MAKGLPPVGARHQKCHATLSDGRQCGQVIPLERNLCNVHSNYFQTLADVKLLHCNDCPFTAHARKPDGTYDIKTPVDPKAPQLIQKKCKYAFFANKKDPHESPCYYEVQDMVQNLDEKAELATEMRWLLEEERRLIKRGLMFQARGAHMDPDVVRAIDNHMRHAESYGSFMGWSKKHHQGDMVEAQSKEMKDKILEEIFGKPSDVAIPDTDTAKHVEAAGQLARDEKTAAWAKEELERSGMKEKPKKKEVPPDESQG